MTGACVLPRTWVLLKESLNILLEGTPRGMKLDNLEAAIRKVEGVNDVHDLHVWSIGSQSQTIGGTFNHQLTTPGIKLTDLDTDLRGLARQSQQLGARDYHIGVSARSLDRSKR